MESNQDVLIILLIYFQAYAINCACTHLNYTITFEFDLSEDFKSVLTDKTIMIFQRYGSFLEASKFINLELSTIDILNQYEWVIMVNFKNEDFPHFIRSSKALFINFDDFIVRIFGFTKTTSQVSFKNARINK